MTPAQLDHLRAIDAHLTALLALAAKRTQGSWQEDTSGVYVGGINEPIADADLWADRDFIAACAGRAEAGWRATLLAITGLQSVINMTEDPSIRLCAESGLKTILSAWPIELLTLP